MENNLVNINILLVAMDVELDAILKEYQGKQVEIRANRNARCYHLQLSNNWLVLKTGVGHINTSICLAEIAAKYEIKNIIHFGVGGSISKDVDTGHYVVGHKIIQHDAYFQGKDTLELMGTGQLYLSQEEKLSTFNPTSKKIEDVLVNFCRDNNLMFHVGNVASGSSFISSDEEKLKIAVFTGCIMVEMEASAAAYFAQLNDIDYGFIKICSDSLTEDSDKEYINFINENIKNTTNLLRYCDEKSC